FTYGDSYPWPDSSDGQGASLVLKNAPSNPNPDVALNWRASSATGGTPGTSETIPSLPNNPNGDSDGNGQADLIDYVLSGNSTPGTVSVDSTDYLTLKFTQKVNAEAANVIVQYSENLTLWTSGGTVTELLDETFNNDGTVTYTWRSIKPRSTINKQFMRLKVTAP
ncbi:MAG: IgG-binding virulence factor TspB family protein, partial [Akkermansiaceae bacterium]